MKILMIYCRSFSFETGEKSLPDVPSMDESKEFANVQLAFIQMEAHDMENPPMKKSVNFIKWLSRKHPFSTVILHSFSHLSESKADPEFSARFLDEMEMKLVERGFTVHQTPYGYFLNLRIDAPGFSLARVFKSF